MKNYNLTLKKTEQYLWRNLANLSSSLELQTFINGGFWRETRGDFVLDLRVLICMVNWDLNRTNKQQ